MEWKYGFPDYENSLVNLANSILRTFGITEGVGEGLRGLDPYLKKGYKNIVVLLLDGMGSRILENNLTEAGFFRSHQKETFSSVFPPTTVAATTSVRSGLQPCEHGWLGWDCYYPQINKNVTVFLNTETGTNRVAADYSVADTYCGYETVVERIQKHGRKAYEVMPFAEPFPQSFEEICEQIRILCQKPENKYIYAYWNQPDGVMHETGCYSKWSKRQMEMLEQQVEVLSQKLENTLLVVTADHGLVDTKNVALCDYPPILECLVRGPSIEPRALNLFVREEKKKQFEEEFQKEFGDRFLLLEKNEVIKSQLFGNRKEHTNFRSMIGDYLAIGTGDLTIFSSREEAEFFIGVHAGLREEELDIPLIVVERP